MEKELNIAAILKDKPETKKIWSIVRGEYINLVKIAAYIECKDRESKKHYFYDDGKESRNEKAIVSIAPSYEMQDWSKFAWKKGDVLVSNGKYIIFEKWANNSYTTFLGVFDSIDNNSLICLTSVWEKETNEVQINKYISQIEKDGGGKLNLSTLEIDKQKQEFKDGDIVTIEETSNRPKAILIYKGTGDIEHCLHRAFYIPIDDYLEIKNDRYFIKSRFLRPATDSEKQQLFDALAKEGKRWNAETKTLENLPKKCKFKPKDWCLMKYYSNRGWELCQYAYMEHHVSACGKSRDFYHSIGGAIYTKCIPYNDQTAHLLGTTDDWKGGEE